MDANHAAKGSLKKYFDLVDTNFMFVESLVGKEFLEMALFELLLFEIEEHRADYIGKFLHVCFERLEDQKIRVSQILHFSDRDQLHVADRAGIEKREWFRIYDNMGIISLLSVRLNRRGHSASVYKDNRPTHIQEWMLAWADEWPERPPLTEDEFRRGFMELAGCFEPAIELQKSKTKRAV